MIYKFIISAVRWLFAKPVIPDKLSLVENFAALLVKVFAMLPDYENSPASFNLVALRLIKRLDILAVYNYTMIILY